MGRGYDIRKASRMKTGHIRTHVIQTRQAALKLPHKYIETHQNEKSNPHQAITPFNSPGGGGTNTDESWAGRNRQSAIPNHNQTKRTNTNSHII